MHFRHLRVPMNSWSPFEPPKAHSGSIFQVRWAQFAGTQHDPTGTFADDVHLKAPSIGAGMRVAVSTSSTNDSEQSLADNSEFSRFMLRSWIEGRDASQGEGLSTKGPLLISSRSGNTGREWQARLWRSSASFSSYKYSKSAWDNPKMHFGVKILVNHT